MLIECPDCKKQVSDQADSCNSCGYSFARKRNEEQLQKAKSTFFKQLGCGCFLPIAIFVAVAVFTQDDPKEECLKLNKEFEGGKYGRSLCSIDACARSMTNTSTVNQARSVIGATGQLSGAWVVLVGTAEAEHPKECKAK